MVSWNSGLWLEIGAHGKALTSATVVVPDDQRSALPGLVRKVMVSAYQTGGGLKATEESMVLPV